MTNWKYLPPSYKSYLHRSISQNQNSFWSRWQESTSSAITRIRTGVPQGWILFPILYNIYTAFPNVSYTWVNTPKNTIRHLWYFLALIKKYGLSELDDQTEYWLGEEMDRNKPRQMSINKIQQRQTVDNFTIKYQLIPWKTDNKYLGVRFDRGPIWGPHIKQTLEKIHRLIL